VRKALRARGDAGPANNGTRQRQPRCFVEYRTSPFHASNMTSLAKLSAAIASTLVSLAALAAPETAPHAAACVAALEAQETTLAETLKGGEPVEPVLLKVVRSGIAIIGTQYLAGLREAEARQLLKAAQQEFQTLPPATASERQAQCLKEGETIFEHSSAFERSLITSAAQRRIRRITAA
jgi:hypothetical protein